MTPLSHSPTLSIGGLETVYDALATAIDQAGPDKAELFLVKLALLNAQALATLKQTPGLQVHSLSAAQRTALRQAVQPVHADFARRVGTPLLRDVKNLCLGGISG